MQVFEDKYSKLPKMSYYKN